MKAISLHQPWASLIMCGAKRVETRSWRPPESLIGERIAIHAAKRIDDCVLDAPFSRYIADPVRDAPQGVLLGSVLLEGAWLIEHRAEAKMVAHEYPSSDAAMRAYPREAWRNVGEDEWNNVRRSTGDALSITGYTVER